MSVWIIVPAYNEAKNNIKKVIESLIQYKNKTKYDIDIVVVDDGSSDNTYDILKAKSEDIFVLRHITNRGQGAALRTGNKLAIKKNADWVVHFDADNQHRIEDLDKIIKVAFSDRYDVILGSRFILDEDLKQSVFKIITNIITNKNTPLFRRLFISLPALIVDSLFTGVLLTDVHNGLRAIRADVLERMNLQFDKMAHATEYIMEIKRLGLKYKEIKIKINYFDIDKKSQNLWDGIRIFFDLLISKFLKNY